MESKFFLLSSIGYCKLYRDMEDTMQDLETILKTNNIIYNKSYKNNYYTYSISAKDQNLILSLF